MKTWHLQQDLKTLNLADNSLGDLEPKVFQMLSKLKTLDLSRNPLEDLQPDVFKDVIVSAFRKGLLSLNWLKHFSIPTPNASKDLKVLKCRGCRLQNINPQLYNLLNQLTDLDFGNNQVIHSEDIYRDETTNDVVAVARVEPKAGWKKNEKCLCAYSNSLIRPHRLMRMRPHSEKIPFFSFAYYLHFLHHTCSLNMLCLPPHSAASSRDFHLSFFYFASLYFLCE